MSAIRYTTLAVATVLRCGATSLMPGTAECWVLNDVVASAAANPSVRPAALEIFERIADLRMDTVGGDLETKVGLRPGILHHPNFQANEVRSCALRDIAKLDMPEALAYLQSLKKEQFKEQFNDGGFSPDVWKSAQIALREAQLNRLPDEPAKIRFLEDTTTDTRGVAWWAVQELCDRGVYQALPFIEAHVTKVYSLPNDIEHAIRFCRQRMDVVSRGPDRVKALGSLLTVRAGMTDSEVLGWAINQLRDMRSKRAAAELDRFADEIEDLPDGSPLKSELWGERVSIRGMAPPRRK
jgi:hypothetical protein